MSTKKKGKLPRGVGQIPMWWLDDVDHDIMEAEKQRKAEEAKVQEQRNNREKGEHASPASGNGITTSTSNRRESFEQNNTSISWGAVAAGNLPAQSQHSQSTQMQYDLGQNSSPSGALDESSGGQKSMNITITTEEEIALVELRRKKSHVAEGFGRDKLKPRPGGIDVELLDSSGRAAYRYQQPSQTVSNAQPHNPSDREIEKARQSNGSSATLKSTKKSPVKNSPFRERDNSDSAKEFTTHFTGVSPFDFAMQQRAREKERREKERIARQALSRHHGHTVEVDKATEMRRKDEEQRRHKKEAQENLKLFKGVFNN